LIIFAIAWALSGIPYSSSQEPLIVPAQRLQVIPCATQEPIRPSAEVLCEKMIRSLHPKMDPAIIQKIAKSVAKWSKEYSIRPELVCAMIEYESEYQIRCTSHNGNGTSDRGLMQLNSGNHYDMISDPYDIDQNIQAGCWEMVQWREVWQKSKSERENLAHYNGGNRPPGVSFTYADRILKLAEKWH
jgi:hypothetical protein